MKDCTTFVSNLRKCRVETGGDWPRKQLELCGVHGVFRWFISPEYGGIECSLTDITRGLAKLASACLTTTFVITQRTAAVRRIAGSENKALKQRLLPNLASGKAMSTVGISHLTTSRRHLAQPVLKAEKTEEGFLVNGFSPWVTCAVAADHLVLGATLENESEILFAIPKSFQGITVEAPQALIGLSASHTGPVRCDNVFVSDDWLIAGPKVKVLASGLGPSTGSFQTSTLALGLAHSAIEFMGEEAKKRSDLLDSHQALTKQHRELMDLLLAAASGKEVCSTEQMRVDANSLVLRATQAALAAAKGSGYVAGHPVGRWCKEALFFLVWSCPQSVLSANLCEFAGIETN